MSDKSQEQATAKAAKATFSIDTCLNCQLMCTAIVLMVKCVCLAVVHMEASFLKSGHIQYVLELTTKSMYIILNVQKYILNIFLLLNAVLCTSYSYIIISETHVYRGASC